MDSKKWIFALCGILFLVSIFLVNQQPERTEFGYLLTTYSVAFFSYLILLHQRTHIPFKFFLILAVGAQLCSIIFEPYLSNDYYRFLWDGEITWAGYNPFDYTPNELIAQGFGESDKYLHQLHDGMGALSRRNYTCYPPVNQLYFVISTAFSNSLSINTLILKLLIVATEVLGIVYLRKLLNHLQIDTSRVWILFLNPLWIIEATGNTHFEGVMVSYLIVAFYFLIKKLEVKGSLFFALAVQIKLVPLMLLPFFYRFLGFSKAAIFYTLTIMIVLLLGFVQINDSNIAHFTQSLQLYFKAFEFNSFILHHYVQYGKWKTGWYMAARYGPQLSRYAIMIITILSLYGQIPDWKTLFKRMTLAYFAYLMLSSTLHPWYILPLLFLSVFTNYSFILFWSFTIFFSYIFYTYNDGTSEVYRRLVDVEYVVVLAVFFYEMIKRKPLLPSLKIH